MNEPMFEIKTIKEEKGYGQYEITPLEHGYGNTLGNSIRRVLLESLTGAAITSVKISGVKHQFSTLKGMKEDVIELVLNLKKVRFSYTKVSDKAEKAKISVKGAKEVKASDINVSGNLKVANPDLVLCTLEKDAKFDAEVTVEFGSGFVPADEQTDRNLGVIPVDAIFSPILRVNYKVEETRVGRLTNFDKLNMEIFTDMTVNPKDALTESAKILIAYYNQVVNPKVVEKVEKKEKDTLGPVGKLSVEEIGLPTRVANALIKAGYETVEELVGADKVALVKVRNLGEKSLKIITVALAEKGVDFNN